MVGIYEISVQTGTCTGFWICYGVKLHMKANSAQWITPFAVQLIPGVLLILGMMFVPESPRYVNSQQARKVNVVADSYLTDGSLSTDLEALHLKRWSSSDVFLWATHTSKKNCRASWIP